MRTVFVAIIAVGLIAPAALMAESNWQVDTSWHGEARAVASQLSEVDIGRPLAEDLSTLPQYSELDTRLRLGGDLKMRRRSGVLRAITVKLEGDLYNGAPMRRGYSDLLRYDEIASRDSQSLDAVMLRSLQLQFDGRYGRVNVGRMMSTWGLGLLAQSGRADPYQFGFKRQGVVVDRLQLITAPFQTWGGLNPTGTPLYAVLAADRVVYDDLADARRGDEAYNLVGALLYRGAELQAGVYTVFRTQTDAQGSTVDAQVGDAFVSWGRRFGDWDVRLATEWLLLQGETTYFRSANQRDALKVFQFGGVFRAQARSKHFGARLEGGLASGDDRPFDDTMGALKFSRDYRVGLIMFHEGMRRTSTLASANIADPRYVGVAPTGFDRAGTSGSVSNAIYGSLTMAAHPVERLTILVGGLMAQSPLPLVDAYQSGLKGGDAIGPRGGVAGRGLGWEVDVALRWTQPLTDALAASARVDWGRWQPGDAFDDSAGKSARAVQMWMARLTMQGRW